MMAEPGFWDNQERARETIDEVNRLKGWIQPWHTAKGKAETLVELAELLEMEPDEELEAELATLKQKPMVNTIAEDQAVFSRVAKDTKEQADKKITAAKASLQKKMDARGGLANAKTQTEKEVTDEHERKMQMLAKEFLLQIATADSEALQKQQLEEAGKEFAARWRRQTYH